MDFEEWEKQPPRALRYDTLWRMTSYRLALFAVDVGWEDVAIFERRRVARSLADQLITAIGSIGANIADGYGRSSGRDRVRLYEYALSSVRESIHWYLSSRPLLPERVIDARTATLQRISQLLSVAIPQECGRTIRDQSQRGDQSQRDDQSQREPDTISTQRKQNPRRRPNDRGRT